MVLLFLGLASKDKNLLWVCSNCALSKMTKILSVSAIKLIASMMLMNKIIFLSIQKRFLIFITNIQSELQILNTNSNFTNPNDPSRFNLYLYLNFNLNHEMSLNNRWPNNTHLFIIL